MNGTGENAYERLQVARIESRGRELYGAEVVERKCAQLRAPLRAAIEDLRAGDVRFSIGRGQFPLAPAPDNFRSYTTRIGNGRELILVLVPPRLDEQCRVREPAAVYVTVAGRNRRDSQRFIDPEAAVARLIEIVLAHEARREHAESLPEL